MALGFLPGLRGLSRVQTGPSPAQPSSALKRRRMKPRALLAVLAVAVLALRWSSWSFLGLGISTFSFMRTLIRGALSKRRAAEDDQLPEAPPGGRVIHVEYCNDCKFLPRYLKLRKAMADRFGERVLCFGNHEETLQELCRTPKPRAGSFEVVDMQSKKCLYTKLGSAGPITVGSTSPRGKSGWTSFSMRLKPFARPAEDLEAGGAQ
ncbi:hypothetical protein AK812_SmicGene13315 [Symbiodinium microadriaticum]|uniref:Uncharacterized protein n=1 Tax=Symbiodinium microadriaticum TaxID=2951 RepID=A0A1Q9E8F4_SYMMI|nr:hypothetical protein AK812_SmicGene13315 [Symbiodinium microadriaticum]